MVFDQIFDVVGLVIDFRVSVDFSHVMVDLLKFVFEVLFCNVVIVTGKQIGRAHV